MDAGTAARLRDVETLAIDAWRHMTDLCYRF
jgi:hypothetical protein